VENEICSILEFKVSVLKNQQQKNAFLLIFKLYFKGLGHDRNETTMHQVFHGLEPQQPVDKTPVYFKRSYDSELSQDAKQRLEKCQLLINENNIPENRDKGEKDDYHQKVNKPKCENKEFNDAYLSTYGLVMDFSLQDSPLVVFSYKPETEVFNLTETREEICVVMEPVLKFMLANFNKYH
jgi:hypothetical protein